MSKPFSQIQFEISTTWRPDHHGILTLWRNGDAIAAVSPIYYDEESSWYWYTYINAQNGFCDNLWEAQAEAERSTSPYRLN
jgi:hypothetical protein